MHRDWVTHVAVSEDDFVITGSRDGEKLPPSKARGSRDGEIFSLRNWQQAVGTVKAAYHGDGENLSLRIGRGSTSGEGKWKEG